MDRPGAAAYATIREATLADATAIARLLRLMLSEMASVGGHAVSRDEAIWARFAAEIDPKVKNSDHLFLLAERAEPSPEPIGLAEARVVRREGVFERTMVLHIHALYVTEALRRQGIGRTLLKAVLEWGRASGCVEAELNVLVANPARELYEGLGFSPLQVEMVRKL